MAHRCENCKLRAKYDRQPGSLLGRLWRWHITWCPGWKKYLNDIAPGERDRLVRHYRLKQN